MRWNEEPIIRHPAGHLLPHLTPRIGRSRDRKKEKRMFKGYRKEAVNTKRKGNATTIEERRNQVVRGIDQWIGVIHGLPSKGVVKLSKKQDGDRLVWLKYANRNIPLTPNGDLTGEIDLTLDEVAFWEWMKKKVLKGEYDQGINDIARQIYEQMRK